MSTWHLSLLSSYQFMYCFSNTCFYTMLLHFCSDHIIHIYVKSSFRFVSCLLHFITYLMVNHFDYLFNVMYVQRPFPPLRYPREGDGVLHPEICGSLCGNSQHSVSTDIKVRSTISIPRDKITHVKVI